MNSEWATRSQAMRIPEAICYLKALNRIGNRDRALDLSEEASQEARYRAHKVLFSFATQSDYNAWVTRVALNRLVDLLRYDSRFEQVSGTAAARVRSKTTDVAALVAGLLQQLEVRKATLLRMYYIEGLSLDEVAERLGVTGNSENARRLRVYRMRNEALFDLRSLFKKKGIEDDLLVQFSESGPQVLNIDWYKDRDEDLKS